MSTYPPQPTKEVYREVCERFGELMAPEGFRYLRSGPNLKRLDGRFGPIIGFGTSHYNQAGEYVCFEVFCGVFSPEFQKFSKKLLPNVWADRIMSANLGNYNEPKNYVRFDVADPDKRELVITSAISEVKENFYPIYERFQNLNELIPFLVENDLLNLQLDCKLMFLACFGSTELCKKAAIHALKKHPQCHDSYRIKYEEYKSRDTFQQTFRPSNYGDTIAYYSRLFDFGDLSLLA
jgi:hypothetical protein